MRASAAMLIALMGTAPAVEAQELLTLSEAVQKAVESSPAIAAAKATRKGIDSKIAEVSGAATPQVSVSATGLSFNPLANSAGSSLGGLGGLGSLGGLSGSSGLSGPAGSQLIQTQVSLSQLLYDGGRLRNGMELSKLSGQLADLEIESTRSKVQHDAATAYLNALRTESLLKVAKSGVSQSQEHLGIAKARLKNGAGMRFEILQAETQLANAQGSYSRAENAVILARLALDSMLGGESAGRALDRSLVLPRAIVERQEIESALSYRTEARQLSLKRSVDETNTSLQRKAFLPTIAGLGSYSYQQPGPSSYYLVGATLQWTLLNGGQTQAKVAQAEAELAKDSHQLMGVRRSIALDIESALTSRSEAVARVSIGERAFESAQEAHRLALVRFKAGIGLGSEVIDAQMALTQANSNLVVARYDIQLSELRVAKALGLDLDFMLKKGS